MTGPGSGIDADGALWQGLIEYSESYTCYSAALAAWSAFDLPSWRDLVNTGLTLDLVEADGGLFGFAHFPPGVQARLQLRRASTDDPEQAAPGILAELESAGRVIVAGDGFSLPWHVAAGRRHVPHWFVLAGTPAQPVVVDPFAARNDLGLQEATLLAVDPATLATLAQAHPGDDDVVALREAFALGRDGRWVEPRRFQWFVRGEAVDPAPEGASGPAAIRRLARHFSEHGDEAARLPPGRRHLVGGEAPCLSRRACCRPFRGVRAARSQTGSRRTSGRSRSDGPTWRRSCSRRCSRSVGAGGRPVASPRRWTSWPSASRPLETTARPRRKPCSRAAELRSSSQNEVCVAWTRPGSLGRFGLSNRLASNLQVSN